MALSILPSDGFITRLLQQAHQPAPKAAPTGSNSPTQKPDQVSISNDARQATESSSTAGNHRLESKLMDLYNQKGQGSI